MRATLYMAATSLRLYARVPAYWFFMIVMPMLLFFVYMSIFAEGEAGTVAGLLGPCMALTVAMLSLNAIPMEFVMMREKGELQPYQLAPVNAWEVTLSRLIALMVLVLILGGAQLLLAVGFYQMPLKVSAVEVLVVLAAVVIGMGGIGILITSITNTGPEATVVSQLTFIVLIILSGITVPLTHLPGPVQVVANFLPTTLGVITFRGMLVNGDPLIIYWPLLVILVIVGLGAIAAASISFRWTKDEKVPRRQRVAASLVAVPLVAAGLWLMMQ